MRWERESLIMAARRRFSAAFKRQVVEEVLGGADSADDGKRAIAAAPARSCQEEKHQVSKKLWAPGVQLGKRADVPHCCRHSPGPPVTR